MKHQTLSPPCFHFIFVRGLIPAWRTGDISHDISVTQGAALIHILNSRNLGSDTGFALWPSVHNLESHQTNSLTQPKISVTERPRNHDKACQDLSSDHHKMNLDVLNGVPF